MPLHPKGEGIFIKGAMGLGLVLATFLFFVSGPALTSLLVSELRIEGNHYVETREIESVLGTKVGDPVSEATIRDDMQAIYDLGYFSEVQILTEEVNDGLVVVFRLRENPRVVRIQLEGVTQEEREKVRRLIMFEEGQILNSNKLEETKRRISAFYHRKGFFYNGVPISQTDSSSGGVSVVILVEREDKIRIAEVVIENNRYFSTEEILSLLRVKRRQYFDEAKLREGMQRVVDKYRQKGYYYAHFKEPVLEVFETVGKRVRDVLRLVEARRLVVSEVKIEGNKHFTDPEIFSMVRPREGEIFVAEFLEGSIGRVENEYEKVGYLYLGVQSDLKFDRDRGTVAISILIQEGVQVRVGKISVSGNELSKERVFKHGMLLKEGDVFDVEKMRESWR